MSQLKLEHLAAPLVAAALGRSLGVEVRFGSQGAPRTNGEVIFIPSLPLEVPDRARTQLWGFIHHEAMHIRQTDFSVFEFIAAENDELLRHLFNILEDVRGEAAQFRLYPGSQKVLRDTMIELVESEFFADPEPDISPSALVCGFLIRELRLSVLGQLAFDKQAQVYRSLLVHALGESFTTRLVAIATHVVGAVSSQEALDIAYQLRALIEEENQSLADDSDPSGSDSPSSAGSDDPTSNSESGAEPQGDPPNEDTSVSSTAGNPEGRSSKQQFLQRVLSPSDDDLSSDCGDLGEALGALLDEELSNSSNPVNMPSPLVSADAGRDVGLITKSRESSARLALQLKRFLEGQKRLPKELGKRGHRLSRRHLHRVALDNPNVFERRARTNSMNTSVIVLLDASSSMNRSTSSGRSAIDVARECVLACGLALDSISNLDSEIAAFSNSKGKEPVELLKAFHERSEYVSSRFSLKASGGTPLSEALLWTINEFAKRPSDHRRIVIVATDGEPNHRATSLELLSMCERVRIEAYGIGIGSEAVSTLFEKSESIGSVEELCPALIGMLHRVLPMSA